MATEQQLATIRARRVDDTARAMMRDGVTLTWDEAGIVGDEACDWIARRLGLATSTDEAGVHFARQWADKVVIETMPDHLRASHRDAGNWGSYPHNGATREVVGRDEAAETVADDEDGYARIVRDATAGELAELAAETSRTERAHEAESRLRGKRVLVRDGAIELHGTVGSFVHGACVVRVDREDWPQIPDDSTSRLYPATHGNRGSTHEFRDVIVYGDIEVIR